MPPITCAHTRHQCGVLRAPSARANTQVLGGRDRQWWRCVAQLRHRWVAQVRRWGSSPRTPGCATGCLGQGSGSCSCFAFCAGAFDWPFSFLCLVLYVAVSASVSHFPEYLSSGILAKERRGTRRGSKKPAALPRAHWNPSTVQSSSKWLISCKRIRDPK